MYRKPIGCDAIAWLGDALDRYADVIIKTRDYPSVSRIRAAAKTAAITEIVDVCGLHFDGTEALDNALAGFCFHMHGEPKQVRNEYTNVSGKEG